MFWILLSLLATDVQSLPCTTNFTCSVFDICVGGACVPNNNGCSTSCSSLEVCIAPDCVPDPRLTNPIPTLSTNSTSTSTTTVTPTLSTNSTSTSTTTVTPTLSINSTSSSATTLTPPLVRPAPPQCPDNWRLNKVNQFCYISVVAPFDFYGALQKCYSLGGDIVSIHSMQEVEFINNLNGLGPYWTGLRKFGKAVGKKRRTAVYWMDGSPIDFLYWMPKRPNLKEATCVLANYKTKNGQWNDVGCGKVYNNPTNAVCRKKL